MPNRLSVITAGVLISSAIGAAAGELPRYRISSFPITPHQLTVLEPASVAQDLSPPMLTVGGMPASPLQIAVLTPRRKELSREVSAKSMDAVQTGYVNGNRP